MVMEARFCNHCEKLFKKEDLTTGVITGFWFGDDENFRTIDLCDICKGKLEKFVYGKS